MKFIVLSITLSLLVGCGTMTGLTSQQVELYYSQEQTTLTSKQHEELEILFSSASQFVADVAPATHDTPFQALVVSQSRLKAIRNIAQQQQIKLIENYQPQQTPDTVILRGL